MIDDHHDHDFSFPKTRTDCQTPLFNLTMGVMGHHQDRKHVPPGPPNTPCLMVEVLGFMLKTGMIELSALIMVNCSFQEVADGQSNAAWKFDFGSVPAVTIRF